MKPLFRCFAFLSPNGKRRLRASSLGCVLSVGALSLLGSTTSLPGGTLYWDASNGNGIDSGAGVWQNGGSKNSDERWNSDGAGTPSNRNFWIAGSDAVFTTATTVAADTVTVAGAVVANSITFSNSGVTTVNIPTATSLTSGTTLVNQNTVATLAGTGTFATTNLNVSTGSNFAIPTVAISGRLSGQGTITGAVAVAGTHSVGGSSTSAGSYTPGIGTQTVTGNLSYATGSIFSWDLAAGPADPGANTANSGSYDKVISSTLAGSGATFNILSSDSFATAFWNTAKSWNDIFSTGTLASVFSSITGSGIAWDSGTQRGNVTGQGYFTMSTNTLSWTAVPEPTSALAGILLGAGLLRRKRR